MKIKAIYKPNLCGGYHISPDELEKSYETLIGKPVKLNFKEEIGIVLDAQHYKNGVLELTLELPDLQGEYIAQSIKQNEGPYAITFMGVSIPVQSSNHSPKRDE